MAAANEFVGAIVADMTLLVASPACLGADIAMVSDPVAAGVRLEGAVAQDVALLAAIVTGDVPARDTISMSCF